MHVHRPSLRYEAVHARVTLRTSERAGHVYLRLDDTILGHEAGARLDHATARRLARALLAMTQDTQGATQ